MARRPIYIPNRSGKLVDSVTIEFTWHPGLSKSQKQKSISSLHSAARAQLGVERILEISSKSLEELGVKLSAFNLSRHLDSKTTVTVESIFQGSKVFTKGGPYTDIYEKSSGNAKRDARLQNSGSLTAFYFEKFTWPLKPRTAFYDWVYLSALQENSDLASALFDYEAFTDIEFNPNKSINCQAASAALYKALSSLGLLSQAISSPRNFLGVLESNQSLETPIQSSFL